MVMSSSHQSSLFYLHSNDSLLSTIQLLKAPTQVSSVGFNNLKKQTTNSLSLSSSTANTSKPNSISKLFTRNRSSLNVNQESTLSISFSDGGSIFEEEYQGNLQKNSGIFKISRKLRSKLKFGNKAVSRPELTILTAGHHNLKVPKKILSSANADELSQKKNVSSPISRGLFHRPHNQTKLEHLQIGIDDPSNRQLHSKFNRTAINLSSQSSNSTISEVGVAALYNFTNPDYSVTETSESSESVLFLDFHKMYMTSADQFLPSRHQRAENGSSNEMLQKVESSRISNEGTTGAEKSFAALYELLRPLYLISKQKHLANGRINPDMALTMEQAQDFVKDHILNTAQSLQKSKTVTNSAGAGSPHDTQVNEDVTSMNEHLDEDIRDLRRKEVGQQLFDFFQKCFTAMIEDFHSNCTYKSAPFRTMKDARDDLETLRDHNQAGRNQNNDHDYLKEWYAIKALWEHFNLKVRYFVLNTFRQLQKHFDDDELSYVRSGLSLRNVKIENALLLAFRDTVVVPHLLSRQSRQDRVLDTNNPYSSELAFFQNEGRELLKPLRQCFGSILSHLRCDFVVSDDQPCKEMVFEEFVQWFNATAR